MSSRTYQHPLNRKQPTQPDPLPVPLPPNPNPEEPKTAKVNILSRVSSLIKSEPGAAEESGVNTTTSEVFLSGKSELGAKMVVLRSSSRTSHEADTIF